MNRLTRYVLDQCLGATLFITVVLTAGIWLLQSLRLIDLIVNRGLSIETFLYLALLIVPRFVDAVLPIALFAAILFTYQKLMSESEIVVMRSAGLSQTGLARPAIYLTLGAVVVLFIMSSLLMPVAARTFKDLQFVIRNQFVSAVLQDGTFTTISDKLTVYIRARDQNGELTGLLVQDERDKNKPVTIVAERGAFVDTQSGTRVFMVNGNRQQFDRETGRLSVLKFEKYTLDLEELRDAPTGRMREPQERYLHELLAEYTGKPDKVFGNSLMIETHQRIVQPLSALALAAIPLACLLSGEFNRRGQTRRILLAIGLAFLFLAADLGTRNLGNRYPPTIPLMYANVALPILVSAWLLLRDRVGLARRDRAALRPA